MSPAQAFLHTRVAPVHLKTHLLRVLVGHCLTVDRERNAIILLELPLSNEEERVVEEELLRKTGIGSTVALARDTLWVRWASKGRLKEVLQNMTVSGVEKDGKAAGMNWDGLKRGFELGMGGRRTLTEN